MSIERLIENGGGVYRLSPDRLSEVAGDVGTTPTRLTVDTHGVADKTSFLTATAAALDFPDYFGHNWDAFYDCLTDRAENHPDGLVLIFTNLTYFVTEQPAEFATALAVLRDAVEHCQGSGGVLLVLIGLADSSVVDGLQQISSD